MTSVRTGRLVGRRLSPRLSLLGLALTSAMAALPLVILFRQAFPAALYVDAAASYRPWELAVSSQLGPPAGPGHRSTPPTVKGIYVTADAAGSPRVFDGLLALAERTEINSLVIDLKDSRNYLAFQTDDPVLKPYLAARPELGDLKDLAKRLHDRGLYLIGRIFVFQDQVFARLNPQYAVRRGSRLWTDKRGLLWLDPAAQPVWAYNVAVATAAYQAGFDEIQFDYIRFPSDGDISSISYPAWDGRTPKAEVMEQFFDYLDGQLRFSLGAPISVDLFGLTMWDHDYDLNIGQRLDKAAPHFDFVSPMVYPSHYPSGFLKMDNPAIFPYEVVYRNLIRGQELLDRLAAEDPSVRLAEVRPWLQDFNLGAVYGPDRVQAQIRAADDGQASGWLLWNAANRYTEAALEPKGQVK